VFTLSPEIAATIDEAPNMVAIPAATPIIKPQETLPVKKPIPVAITAKAAKVLPAPPVTILNALHITLFKEFELTLAVALRSCAKASVKPRDEDKTGKIVTAEIATKEKIDRFFEKFFIVF
jgi:hypothetical protein